MKPWWSKKWGKEELCGITLTRLRPGKNSNGIPYVVTLKCGHSFYTSALIKWIENSVNNSCPTCRTVIQYLPIV